MKSILTSAVTAFAITGMVNAASAAAQVSPRRNPAPPTLIQPIYSDAVTAEVVALLKRAETICGQVPAEYRVDCLRMGLRAARDDIKRRPDYADAVKEMRNAERALDQLVKSNLDRAAPTIRAAGLTMRAVKAAAVPQVAASASRVLAETATRLLRSTGSAERQAQYTKIARAVDSTKVILRT